MTEEKISKEMKRKIFELTLALYRVTDFFPSEEILKKQLRQKANDILGLIAEYSINHQSRSEIYTILAKIKSIKSYLALAKHNKMVKAINVAVLEREYEFFEGFFERELEYFEEAIEDIVLKSSRHKKTTAIERDVIFHQKVSVENGNGNGIGNVNVSNEHGHDHTHMIEPKKESILPNAKFNERQVKMLDYLKGHEQAKISDLTGFFADLSSKTIQRDLNDLVIRGVIKKEGEKRWTVYSLVS